VGHWESYKVVLGNVKCSRRAWIKASKVLLPALVYTSHVKTEHFKTSSVPYQMLGGRKERREKMSWMT